MADVHDDLSGGQEVQSNWFKFVKPGDGIKGTLLSSRFQPSSDATYPNQWVYELRRQDGSTWNVGISEKKQGTVQRLSQCRPGDIIGILFEKEGTSAVKGGAKAKMLKVLSFGRDKDFDSVAAAPGRDALDDLLK